MTQTGESGGGQQLRVRFWLRRVAQEQAARDHAHRNLREAIARAEQAGASEDELDAAQRGEVA